MRAAAEARSCSSAARRAGLRGTGRARCGGGGGRPPVRQVNTVLTTNAAFCGSARKRTRPCEHSTMSTARRGAQRRVSSCAVTRHGAKPSGANVPHAARIARTRCAAGRARTVTRKVRAGTRSQGVQRCSAAAELQRGRVVSERGCRSCGCGARTGERHQHCDDDKGPQQAQRAPRVPELAGELYGRRRKARQPQRYARACGGHRACLRPRPRARGCDEAAALGARPSFASGRPQASPACAVPHFAGPCERFAASAWRR